MRVASIQKNFEGEMKGVISISSPYMQISSAIKKKYHTKINKKKLDLNDKIPTKLMEKAIASWVRMAKAQRNNIQANPTLPVVTYEQFCSNPNSLVQAFSDGHANVQGTSATTKVEGKKYTGIDVVMDMTCKNLSFLSLKEISVMTKLLARHEKLIHFLGYNLLSTKDVVGMYEKNMPLVIDGLHSRLHS